MSSTAASPLPAPMPLCPPCLSFLLPSSVFRLSWTQETGTHTQSRELGQVQGSQCPGRVELAPCAGAAARGSLGRLWA